MLFSSFKAPASSHDPDNRISTGPTGSPSCATDPSFIRSPTPVRQGVQAFFFHVFFFSLENNTIYACFSPSVERKKSIVSARTRGLALFALVILTFHMCGALFELARKSSRSRLAARARPWRSCSNRFTANLGARVSLFSCALYQVSLFLIF